SLTNAAKHSRASETRVDVRIREGNVLWARVEDNGMGGAQVQPGGGLDGISNRVLAAGGTIRIDSPQGGPTSVEVSVPCATCSERIPSCFVRVFCVCLTAPVSGWSRRCRTPPGRPRPCRPIL